MRSLLRAAGETLERVVGREGAVEEIKANEIGMPRRKADVMQGPVQRWEIYKQGERQGYVKFRLGEPSQRSKGYVVRGPDAVGVAAKPAFGHEKEERTKDGNQEEARKALDPRRNSMPP